MRRRRGCAWRSSTGGRPSSGFLRAAAVVIVLGVVGALGFAIVDQRSKIDRLEQQYDLAAAADNAFADPNSRTAELRSEDGAVQAIAVVRPNGEGYLVARDLPELDDRIYQLWGVADDKVVSLGVLGADPGVAAFSAGPDFTTLAVTAEDEPVVASSQPAVVSGILA